jgi:hypothetical protein
MRNNTIFLFMLIVFFVGNAQNNFWTLTESRLLDGFPKMDRDANPTRFETYHLNFSQIKNSLLDAPDRTLTQNSALYLSFPLSDGKMESFKIFKASIMHQDLASRYPDIQSYVGFGTADKTAMIRFSVTVFGLHGFISSGKSGNTYIDTYTKDLNYYIVYNKKNIPNTRGFECLVQDEVADMHEPIHFSPRNTNSINANTGIFRTYRLAMACTIEFAAFHVNAAGANNATLQAKKAVVLAAMNVTMTRVNGIFEKDMALTMQLVPENDAVIFIDSDNFNNDNSSQLINQSQTTIHGIRLSTVKI